MKDVSLKLALTITAAITAVSSFPLTALQASTAMQQGTSVSAGGMQASAQGQADASAAVPLQPVNGELDGKLDTKTVKVGDLVVVKTKTAVKITGGTEIPKGAKLVGKVIDVQAHGAGSAGSRIAIQFDRAELKNGQSIAIRSVIESVQPPVDLAASSADSSAGGLGGAPMAGGRASAVGGAPVGGMVRGAVGGANTTTGEPALGSVAGSTLGSVARDTNAVVATDATARAGSAVEQVPGKSGGVIAHATGVDGVFLSNEASTDASAAASGTLYASKKNVRLQDGTQIVLGIAGANGR